LLKRCLPPTKGWLNWSSRSTNVRRLHCLPYPKKREALAISTLLFRGQKIEKIILQIRFNHYICTRNKRKERRISSAGSEHLPYKQGVTASNPVSPTTHSLGSFAQLVQSTCLTGRGSLVRTHFLRQHQKVLFSQKKGLFLCNLT